MADEDVVIEIPQDDATPVVVEPKVERPTVVKTEEPAKIVTADEGIEDLKRQRDEALHRASQSDTVARQNADKAKAAEQEVIKFKSSHEQSQYGTLVAGIDAAKSEADLAQKEYEEAFSTGDASKAAQAQRKLARAEARLTTLEDGKSSMELEIDARKNAKPDPVVQQLSADPVDDYIGKFSPRSQNWLRARKDYVTDSKKNLRLIAAHNEALSEDHVTDSDSYFDFIERKLGLKQDPGPVQQQQTRTRTPMPAAPVSHTAAGGNGGGRSNTQVVLTSGEQKSATDGTIVWNYDDPKRGAVKGEPIGLREMAIRKASMSKEGRYATTNTDQ